MFNLTSPLSELKGIGPSNIKRLKSLGVEKIIDLIQYFPYRWEDFSNIIKINEIKPHEVSTIKGKVQLITNHRSFRRRMFITESLVADGTGSVKVVWFNQPYLIKILKPGDEIILSGKINLDYLTPQFMSPSFEKIKPEQTHTGRIVPVYSLTHGVSQRQMRYWIKSVLSQASNVSDFLPTQIKSLFQLSNLAFALKQIHFPDTMKTLTKAQERLRFDEIFMVQVQALENRRFLRQSQAPKINFLKKESQDFVKSLPFTLTLDQRKAAWEIIRDLGRDYPMNRLLEGDVGSGKTVVAMMAVVNAVKNGYQCAYMAPTEILARQNFEKMQEFLKPFNINLGLFTRSMIRADNREIKKPTIIKKIMGGELNLVCGTHTLIQENVSFKNLALVIVDEQHRFGVNQRKVLRNKASSEHKLMPHLLSMTATPIPRTMALAVYGDLDLSIIKQQPKGRKKIITRIVPVYKRPEAYNFIRKQIQAGRQAFVICPLIEPSDRLGVKSVKQEFEKLDQEVFQDFKIGLMHGRLKSEDKEKVMNEFKKNQIKILVSTSVVEVGIDIPNATVMMIEGADRFGLSQLHQFRGRVGRGEHQSYFFLFTESDSLATLERLEALEKSSDGFELAEVDLKMRGPGEIAGVRQSGMPDFKMASLADAETIKKARAAALKLFETDPDLEKSPLLKQKLDQFQKDLHLE